MSIAVRSRSLGAAPTAVPASPLLGQRALPDEVAAALAALPSVSISELRSEWRQLYRNRPPAKLRRNTLELVVAWQLQARPLGGVSVADQRRLTELADQETTGAGPKRARRVTLKPGVRLVREWAGETHEVLVIDGGFIWHDRRRVSASVIARAITGARWSGPRFLDLGGPSAAKRTRAAGEGAHAAG